MTNSLCSGCSFKAPLALLLTLLLASCDDDVKNRFQGYAEGEYVYVATSVAGRLDKLMVSRGQTMGANAPLFELEHENETAEVQQAKAQLGDLETGKRKPELDVLRAQLGQAITAEHLSATQATRDERQYKIGAISKAQLDTSRSTHVSAKSHVEELRNQLKTGKLPGREEQIRAAKAALAQALWKLSQKSASTAQAALVFDTLFVEGEWVPAGTPVVSLLPPGNIKVRFFVPEETEGKLKVGQTATVHCDGCAKEVAVHITYISPEPEFTPPVIYSNETRSKLVFMIEARPKIEDAALLHPGQPVEVRVNE
jgi:HlyD family secretion protein